MNNLRLLLCSFLLCFVLPCHPITTTTKDIITSSGNGLLKDGETIVSAGKSFELGFFPDPMYPNDWKAGGYSVGCSRKSGTSCNQNITFLNLTSMKVDYPYPSPNSKTEEQCRKECLDDWECLAYSFGGEQRREDGCRIWTAALNDLQDDYDHGFKLSVRVADIEAGSSSERTKSSSVIISISVILAVVILCSVGYIIYRRNLVHKRQGNQVNNFAIIGDQEDELLTEDDKKAIDIPYFSQETI